MLTRGTDASAHLAPDAVRSAWRVSVASVTWTVVVGAVAVALGLRGHSAALEAFGAIGFIDAAGSVALVVHFRHGLRHEELSERLEALAHRVVVVGLITVGLAAVVVGVVRLVEGRGSRPSSAGLALAAASLVVLLALSSRKVAMARRISSGALRADGLLSGIGALQAAVTLVGTAATRSFGWHWADAAAATVVGGVAIAVGFVSRRT